MPLRVLLLSPLPLLVQVVVVLLFPPPRPPPPQASVQWVPLLLLLAGGGHASVIAAPVAAVVGVGAAFVDVLSAAVTAASVALAVHPGDNEKEKHSD